MKRMTGGIRALVYGLCSVVLIYCLQGNAWAQPGVSTDKATYAQGETIRVHFSGASGYNTDWMCIVPSGAPDTDAGNYQYLPYGVYQGYLSFVAPGPGEYEVRAYYNYSPGAYMVSARQSFVVEGEGYTGEPRYRREDTERRFGVSTDRDTYLPGEPIRVRFSGAPGYTGDWLCIVRAGAPDTAAGNYQYLPYGAHHGRLIFTASRPGNYQVRAYYDYRRNGYAVSARHSFAVVEQVGPRVPESGYFDPKLKQAQYILMERGYDPGAADGMSGRKTRAAIRQFQRDNRLRPSGMLDRVTLKALGLLQAEPAYGAGRNKDSKNNAVEGGNPEAETANGAARDRQQTPVPASPPAQAAVTGAGWMTAATPMFSKASAMADSLGDVPQGAAVDILGEQNNFCKIRYNGKEGYVFSNLVKREKGQRAW